MAYSAYNEAKPDPATDNGTTACSNIRNNFAAMRDGIILGGMPGWTYAQSGGTAAEPTVVTFSNANAGYTTEKLKHDLTWVSGQITTAVSSFSVDTGTTYTALGTAVMSYSSGEMTASTSSGTNGGMFGGFLAKVMSVFGKITALTTSFNAHTAANGTAVHGLGNISTQSSASVSFSGGGVNNVTVGATTQAPGNFTYEREFFTDIGTAVTATTKTIDASVAGWYEMTLPTTGTVTITMAGLAPANLSGGLMLNVITGATLPTIVWSNMTWAGGTTPTLTVRKKNLITVMSRNNVSAYFGNVTGAYA